MLAVKFIFHFLALSLCLILSSLSYTQIPIILFSTLTLTHRDWPHSPTVCRIALCSLHFCQFHSTAQRSRSDFSNDYSPPVSLNKSLSQASGSQTRPSNRHRGSALSLPFERKVHPEILPSFSHPHVSVNPYAVILFCGTPKKIFLRLFMHLH